MPAALDHDHHAHGRALTVAARRALESAGEQWTQMRANVFEELAAQTRPASAYDIAARLSDRAGRRIAANSVYRILALFVANNLARRIESANAFMVNSHPGCVHDCIFLICESCGAVAHIDDDALANDVRAASRESGFRPTRPVIEVHGRCAACAAADA